MSRMARYLNIIAAVTALSWLAAVPCPRTAMACNISRQSAHDCCKHRTTLRADNCCCKGATSSSSPALSNAQGDQLGKVLTATLPSDTLIAAIGIDATPVWQRLHRGLAPPNTPVTQHTLLLL